MMNHSAKFSTNNRLNPSNLRTFVTQTATKSERGASADIISEEVLASATSEEDQFFKKLR